MHSYSLSVALFDFVPILLSALGLVVLARAITARHRALGSVAWAAALLIPLGGICKASWKLIIALGEARIDWLENMLFILLAPGFVAMAFSLYHATQAWGGVVSPELARYPLHRLLMWLGVPILGAAAATIALPDTRLWFFWLLGITTAGSAALVLNGVRTAQIAKLPRWVHAFFVYNFLAALALSGLARLPDTESTAWIQELVNFSAQAAFAMAAMRLAHRMHRPL